MDDENPRSPPITATTRNFRESTHLIPTLKQEERPKSYEPPQMQLWVILPASLFMILLGVGLEVALAISNKNHGFFVPQKNVFKFASQQFLTSFFPILLVAPLALLWESKNWLVKRYQPYINLARGNATAEDSLLLDYISINTLYCVWMSFAKRHWLVFISAVVGLSTLLLQPLAGAIFDIQQLPEPLGSTVQSIRTLGLDPERFQLTSFLAAAGYAQAAVSNGLPDPPFVHGNWSTADFKFPTGDYLNGTISVNTTGIRTNATCDAPASFNLSSSATPYVITATSKANCPISLTFDPTIAQQQYNVSNVTNCGPYAGQNVNVTFQPVFFWFYRINPSTNAPQAAGVFCTPTLEVWNVTANASLSDGSLGNVTKIAQITGPNNNVTGSPQNGMPFNGVIFDPSPDSFVAARAVAIRGGVPGAILQAVLRNNSVSQTAFTDPEVFVDATTTVYTQHLALIAKNNYLLPVNETLPNAITVSLRPRLVIEPLAAHFLSVLLIIIGVIMLVVGLVHRHIRKGVFLASPPGSIASAVALTSHSGFGMFLVPYDTELHVATKLEPLLFHLDKRTGAVVASDRPGYEYALNRGEGDIGDTGEQKRGSKLTRGKSASVSSQEETRMSLLGKDGGSPLAQSGYLIEPFSPPPGSPSNEKA